MTSLRALAQIICVSSFMIDKYLICYSVHLIHRNYLQGIYNNYNI